MGLPLDARSTWEWILVLVLFATVGVDAVCGVALIVALEWMLALAGLSDGEVARLIMPALGVTLLAISGFAALAMRWCLQRHEHGYQLAILLGMMLVGVGMAQWFSAGGLVGPLLDSTRGVVTATSALMCWRTFAPRSDQGASASAQQRNPVE